MKETVNTRITSKNIDNFINSCRNETGVSLCDEFVEYNKWENIYIRQKGSYTLNDIRYLFASQTYDCDDYNTSFIDVKSLSNAGTISKNIVLNEYCKSGQLSTPSNISTLIKRTMKGETFTPPKTDVDIIKIVPTSVLACNSKNNQKCEPIEIVFKKTSSKNSSTQNDKSFYSMLPFTNQSLYQNWNVFSNKKEFPKCGCVILPLRLKMPDGCVPTANNIYTYDKNRNKISLPGVKFYNSSENFCFGTILFNVGDFDFILDFTYNAIVTVIVKEFLIGKDNSGYYIDILLFIETQNYELYKVLYKSDADSNGWIIKNNEVKAYHGKNENVVIPNGVTAICSLFLPYNVTSVEIPDSVTAIYANTFNGCSNLKKIKLGKNLISIGNDAFLDCTSLVEVCNLSQIKVVPGSKDNGQLGLYVKILTSSCAEKSKSIETNGLNIIVKDKEKILLSYNGLNKDVLIPEGVTTINVKAFYNSEIETVVLPSTLRIIEDEAFLNCKFLKSINLSDGLIKIGKAAFKDCCSLKELTIPGSVETIREKCMFGCKTLEKVELKEGIKTIEDHAFSHTYNLKSILLPKTIEKINCQPFSHYSDPTNSNPEIIWDRPTIKKFGKSSFSHYNGKCLNIPSSLIETGEEAFKDTNVDIIWPNDCKLQIISENTFNNYSGKKIIIPKTVTKICRHAFYNCSAPIEWEKGSQIKEFDDSAFGFYAGDKIVLPDSLETYNANAFDYYFATIDFGTNKFLTKIRDRMALKKFYSDKYNTQTCYVEKICNSCKKLKSYKNGLYAGTEESPYLVLVKLEDTYVENFVFHNETKYIADKAFRNCIFLTDLKLPKDLLTFGINAFEGCNTLKRIVIPKNVMSISIGAFTNCKSLSEVVIENEEILLSYNSFSGCNNLNAESKEKIDKLKLWTDL